MCRSCVDDAVVANEAAMKPAGAVDGTASQAATAVSTTTVSANGRVIAKVCSACRKDLPEDSFSKRQWGVTGTARKCKSCVDATIAENEANMANHSKKASEAEGGGGSRAAAEEDEKGESAGTPNIGNPGGSDAGGMSESNVNGAVAKLLKPCSKCSMRLSEISYTPSQWGKQKGEQQHCNFCLSNPSQGDIFDGEIEIFG